MLTWSWTRAAVKNKSLYLCCILRPAFSTKSPLKYSGLWAWARSNVTFLKIGCLVLFASLLGSTMGDKFAPQEPFVGRAAEAICSLLWKRHLTLHLSPPAAGYNSTHLEPLSRGAEQSSCIIILHNNGCSGTQETNIEYIPERLSWGTEVKGPEGGPQGGKAEGRKVRKKDLNKLVHQTRPFSRSVGEMLLPHLVMLDVIVLQRALELPLRTGASSAAAAWSMGRAFPVLPRTQGAPSANSHLMQGRRWQSAARCHGEGLKIRTWTGDNRRTCYIRGQGTEKLIKRPTGIR